jgi:hypothetical protein
MKKLNKLACLLVIAIASVASAQNTSLKIANETQIFVLDKSRDITENSGLHSMRISPDGKTLLYVERLPRTGNQGRGYRLVLRDIKTGKDTVLPGAPSESDDFLVAYVSMHPFDATGKKIILPVCGSELNNEPVDPGDGQMQLNIYDIATGKVTDLSMNAPVLFPSYDAAGKNIIVFVMFKGEDGPDMELSKIVVSPSKKIKFRKIGVVGVPRTPCPIGDILPILILPNPKKPGGPREPDLIVYDMKANKKVATPPLISDRKLGDHNPQWTADGRFLYYVDSLKQEVPMGMPGYKPLMRVWDRKKLVQQSMTEGLLPIGPVPGKAGMIVLGKENYSYSIHNPATGKTSPILDGKTKIISITGRFMVCVKQSPDGTKFVYRSEIK